MVIVDTHDLVENRLIDLPPGLPAHALIEASNYLNDRFAGRSLEEASRAIEADMTVDQADLDAETQRVIEAGLAVRTAADGDPSLILTGRARTLEGGTGTGPPWSGCGCCSRRSSVAVRSAACWNRPWTGSGVHVFIGAETELFALSGCSMIVAPIMQHDSGTGTLGAIGVIGPHQAQLCPHHPHGGLHGSGRRPPARLNDEERDSDGSGHRFNRPPPK